MNDLDFDWQRFLIGEEEWKFLYEVTVRAALMFFVVLTSLRIMGRRAVMQGVFEVALIISLGSAAGDAMFYSKVGLLPALLVFVVIVLLYRFINFLMSKSWFLEKVFEGKVIQLVEGGVFIVEVLREEKLTRNEIFADLRLQNVSQLGQVEKAYIEPNGKMSIFFYEDDKVKYGLPIFPENIQHKSSTISEKDFYSCWYCGDTKMREPVTKFRCEVCGEKECIKSVDRGRVK
jgi:uncharacterized membrane protein YcaP (DUF421 family)